jgi:DNA polymerase Ligase (LigD)
MSVRPAAHFQRRGVRQSSRIGGPLMARFVLLEHHWDGVHWDLMLDVGAVLRTWAIDAPIVPGVFLPARALGDHRRAYLDYEGVISGDRGWVRQLDSGLYEPRIWTPEWVQVVLSGAQLVGFAELRRVGVGGSDLGPESARAWTFRLGNLD